MSSMRSGVGFAMDCDRDFGCSIERAQKPFLKHGFLEAVERILPVKETLARADACVVDIGCGTCTALRALYARYPLPGYFGLDSSEKVLSLGRELNALSGAKIETRLVDCCCSPFSEPSLSNSFDLAISTDVIHDMCDPVAMLKAVQSLLKPNGVYLVCEPNSKLASHWSAPMHFGVSLAACLPSGTCCPPRLGIGQLGMTPEVLEQMSSEAGFVVDHQAHIDDFFHSFYVLKKRSMSCL